MAPLQQQAYVFDPRPRYPFLITAKRYWDPTQHSEDADALTLVCAHATGYHKEHYEPAIRDLYDALAKAGASNTVKIREVWSIDAPNHGDAAVLNEEPLSWGHTPIFDWQEYSRSIHALLAGLGTGVDVDFSTRKLVAVGHSMGAVSLILADTFMPEIKFASVILVDPMFYKNDGPTLNLADLSTKRRDIWPSFDDAYKQLQSRAAFKVWDPRILEIYVKHGLRPLPSLKYPDKEGVTLKCTPEQEVACYKETVAKARAFTYLPHVCDRTPVHFIFGGINDMVARKTQDAMLEDSAKGRYTSVTRIPNVGHLVVQCGPKDLAGALYHALSLDVSRNFAPGPHRQSKL